MSESDLKMLLLEKYLSDECDAVGPTYLQEIVENKTKYEAAEGGSNIDLEVVITVLVGTIELIEKAIQAYKYIQEKRGKSPSLTDLQESVESKLESQPAIDIETREKIYYDIAEYLRNLQERKERPEI